MLSTRSALLAFTVMVGTLAVTACGTIHASGSSGAASGSSAGHAAASPTQAPLPTQAPTAWVEAYTIPNANPLLDGSVYAQLVANGTVSGRASFGTGTDVWQVHPSSPQSAGCACLIAYQSDLGHSEVIQLPTRTQAGWQVALPGAAQQRTALQFGSTLVAQSGTAVAQATFSASRPQMITPGHTYRLPVINPDPVAGVLPLGYKGIVANPSPGQVLAMIRTTSGHLIALASTGRGAAIADLSTGHSRPLAGYGQLGAAALAPDGQIYALAWRALNLSFTIKVLRISPSTLAVTRTYDAGVTPGEVKNTVVLPAGSSNAIIGLFYGDEHGVTATLWTLAGTSMRSMGTLPSNIALDASVIGGDVYLFGGPAKNQVSRLTISTGGLTRNVPSLRAPATSWVVAVSAA